MPTKILLHGKYGEGRFALCDEDDFDSLDQHRWVAQQGRSTFYGYSKIEGRSILMHRLLLSPPDNLTVDHINGNGLDNRRENLRLCTMAQNLCNQKSTAASSSQFLGVWAEKGKPAWRAAVTKGGETHHLGTYGSEKEAARAYDYLAAKLHGEYARFNFPNLPRVRPETLSTKR